MALEHSEKLNAIYRAFEPYLSHDQLMSALICWEDRYSGESTFSVRYYIAEVNKQIANSVPSKTLHKSLIGGLATPPKSDLPIETMMRVFKSQKASETQSVYLAPEIEAFQVLIKKLLLSIDKSQRRLIIFQLRNQIDALAIDETLKKSILSWLSGTDTKLDSASVEIITDLRAITTELYTTCCSYIGPNETDELLSSTMNKLTSNGGAIYAAIFKKLL